MRIGIVTPGFAEHPGSMGLPAVVDLVTQLAATHDVRVVALRHPPLRRPYRLDGLDGPTVFPLGLGTARGALGRAAVLTLGIATVRRLHRERPFDVLHALWADEPAAVATAAGRVIGRPVIVSVLGGELVALREIDYGAALGRGGRWTVAAGLAGADLVTVGSASMLKAVGTRVSPERLVLLPLGVDLAVFTPPTARPADIRVVLWAGALDPVKDPVTALRAIALVARDRPDLRLRIAGAGRLRPGLERLARRLGLEPATQFLGELPRPALAAQYQEATLLAVSSRHEAQSMVAVEAAASGLPVVGTAVGVLPDLGDAALAVPVGDHRALAAAIGVVLDDPDLAGRMGRHARAMAEERFGLDRTTSGFEAAYRAVMEAR